MVSACDLERPMGFCDVFKFYIFRKSSVSTGPWATHAKISSVRARSSWRSAT